MATAITEDFVTKNGIVILGTSAVTSSTSQSNALQVGGGAAIAANLIVGTTATIGDKLTVGNDTYINGKVTATGVVSITNSSAATTASTGALVVTGGIYAGGNVVISNANASTATITSNALYVEGGAAFNKSLWVVGPARFDNDVVFSGATTYVYSTNTVYTDNLIELHTPSNSTEWTVDDGKDIGLRFHYYSTTGTNAALVLANDTKYLEWYGSGAESNTGTFGGAVYGTFKTGYVKLTSTDTAISTITGALQTIGGIGIGGTIYGGADISGATLTGRNLTQGRIALVGLNGQLTDDATLTYNTTTNYITAKIEYANTATNLKFGARGSIIYQSSTGTTDYLAIGNAGYVLLSANGLPEWSTFAGVTSGRATTASNIAFGADMQIPFQNGVGSTAFDQNLRYEYNSLTFRSVNAIFTGTTAATNTSTGALQVVGGLGVGQDIYIGGNEYIFGDIAVLGGDITTDQTTFNLLNSTATTVNFAGSGTAITVGSSSGYTKINSGVNATTTSSGALQVIGGVGIGQDLFVGGNEYIFGDIAVLGGDITTNQTTFNLLNTTATTVNFAGSGTAITIGASIGYTAIRNQTTVTNTTAATSTSTGALQVYGGVGIGGNIYVGGTVNISNDEIITGNLAVNGGNITTNQTTFNLLNTTATTVNFAGSGTAVTIGSSSGYTKINSSVNATTTNSGALQVVGGIGVAQDLFVGGNEIILGDIDVRGGDITTNQTTFNLLNATASTINFAGAGTAITIGTTTGYTEIRNQTTITNTTIATSTSTGALQVRGGVGVGGNLYVGGTTVLTALTATNTTVTNLTVNGTAGVAGVASFTEGSNATLVGNGAVKVTGGVSISRDMVVGGQITAGTTLAATTGTSVPALYSNNSLLASFTSNVLTGTAQVSLDTFSSTAYRSARYFVQIVDGSNIQLSELSVFHNGASAYLSEYGISTNNGQLGVFDATWDASNVTIKFKPTNATSMVIKMVRTTITL